MANDGREPVDVFSKGTAIPRGLYSVKEEVMSAEFDREFTAEIRQPPLEVTELLCNCRHFVLGPTVIITVATKADSEQHNALVDVIARWNERRRADG